MIEAKRQGGPNKAEGQAVVIKYFFLACFLKSFLNLFTIFLRDCSLRSPSFKLYGHLAFPHRDLQGVLCNVAHYRENPPPVNT